MPVVEAMTFWEKAQIEPYAPRKDVHYALCCPSLLLSPSPSSSLSPSRLASYLKEVSTLYELCNLGLHSPCPSLLPSEGLLSLPDPSLSPSPSSSPSASTLFEIYSLLADSCELSFFPSLSRLDHRDPLDRHFSSLSLWPQRHVWWPQMKGDETNEESRQESTGE